MKIYIRGMDDLDTAKKRNDSATQTGGKAAVPVKTSSKQGFSEVCLIPVLSSTGHF